MDAKDSIKAGLLSNGYSEDEAVEFIESLEEDAVKNEMELDDYIADSNLLFGLDLSFMSPVDVPAQDSRWLLWKDAKTHWKREREVVLRKKQEQQIAYAPALKPGEKDKHGDIIPSSEIERAAHKFLLNDGQVDLMHNTIAGYGEVVETWTLKKDESFTTPSGEEVTYPAGTWILGIKFNDDTWAKIKSGELTGLSIYGTGGEIQVKSDLVGKIHDVENEVKNISELLGKYIKKQEDIMTMTEEVETSKEEEEETSEEPEEVEQTSVEEAETEVKAEDEEDPYDKALDLIAEKTGCTLNEIKAALNSIGKEEEEEPEEEKSEDDEEDEEEKDEDEDGPGAPEKHPHPQLKSKLAPPMGKPKTDSNGTYEVSYSDLPSVVLKKMKEKKEK